MEFFKPKREKPKEDAPDLSRRGFLRGVAAVGAAALIPKPVEAGIQPSFDIRKSLEGVTYVESLPQTALIPEYERKMKEVFLVFMESTPTPGSNVDQILKRLPDYTRIRALMPAQGKSGELEKYLRANNLKQEFLPIPVQGDPGNSTDVWAQDFGSAIRLGEASETIVVPLPERLSNYKGATERMQERLAQMHAFVTKDAKTPLRIVQAPFLFEGGNVMFDRKPDGTARILAGFDTFMMLDEYKSLSTNEVAEILAEQKKIFSDFFGGAEVLVMGNFPQLGLAFHIDQSFTLLPNGHVVCTMTPKPAGYEERIQPGVRPALDVDQLYEQQMVMNKQLKDAGYTVHELMQPLEDLKNHYFSVNGSLYTNAETNQLTFIMPVFPGQYDPSIPPGQMLVKDDLQGTAKEAYDLFTRLGCEVRPAKNSGEGGGNIHCMLNQLAFSTPQTSAA